MHVHKVTPGTSHSDLKSLQQQAQPPTFITTLIVQLLLCYLCQRVLCISIKCVVVKHPIRETTCNLTQLAYCTHVSAGHFMI